MPRQCAHWLAMTDRGFHLRLVIANQPAGWCGNPFLFSYRPAYRPGDSSGCALRMTTTCVILRGAAQPRSRRIFFQDSSTRFGKPGIVARCPRVVMLAQNDRGPTAACGRRRWGLCSAAFGKRKEKRKPAAFSAKGKASGRGGSFGLRKNHDRKQQGRCPFGAAALLSFSRYGSTGSFRRAPAPPCGSQQYWRREERWPPSPRSDPRRSHPPARQRRA